VDVFTKVAFRTARLRVHSSPSSLRLTDTRLRPEATLAEAEVTPLLRLVRLRAFCALLVLAYAPAERAFAQACPSGPRVPFAGHSLPLDSLPDPAPLTAVRTYPNLSFSQPTSLQFAPDGSGTALLTEQIGRVRLLSANVNATSAGTFLDLGAEVQYDGSEQGLLSVAFDPGFASNGFIYLHYVSPRSRCATTTTNYCTKVTRYTRSASNPSQADPATQRVLLEVPDDNAFHNGGQIAFGPDGMLYASFGDAGTYDSQVLSRLVGTIVRIDPNGGNPYAIPPGNPFVGQAGKRAEIWHYGMRNPWRFTFDRLTGDMWVGDVGEIAWEEVNFVPAGGSGRNFGWAYCEGTHNFGSNQCSQISSTLPVIEYGHDSNGGYAVTGGYVYRGDSFPELYGAYVYADYVSGRVWAYNPSSQGSTLVANMTNPVSFGEDALGELVIVSRAGQLYRLQTTSGSGSQQFPTLLSATGVFSNVQSLTPAAGLIPYDVISPLWSDGALKRRWLALPAGQTIEFSPDDPWTFPVGTVFVKHFELQVTPTTRRRLETRVLLRQVDRWVGYTYRWNPAETDATLLTAALDEPFTIDLGGGPTQQTWHYPSPAECLGCHTTASERVLGVRTRQLNRTFAYPGGSDSQLHAFGACMNLFGHSIEPDSFYPAMADPANAAESLQARARSYLAANCAHCHQPGGPAPGGMDMRYEPLLGAMNLIGVTPTNGNMGVGTAQRVKVGSSAESVLWLRSSSTDPALRMAKGTRVPDPLGMSLLASWINSGLVPLDSDADGDADSADNCPYEPNANQSDLGRWLLPVPDGVGDACQCESVDADGKVNHTDLLALRQVLAGGPAPVPELERRLRYLDVAGRASILDVTHYKRSLEMLEPKPGQTCGSATKLEP